LQHRYIGLRVRTDRLRLQFLPVGERHFDFVRSFDNVMIGENVSLRADDHARAKARRALRLLFELVAEETAKQGIVEERMTRGLDFLAGEDIHNRGYRLPDCVAVGRGAGGYCRACRLAQLHHLRPAVRASEPFRFQRGDHEQHADRDRRGLCEDEPDPAHELLVGACLPRMSSAPPGVASMSLERDFP
jgi:hypothetical protein